VLADDQVLIRKGLASVLGEWEGVAAVWEAGEAGEAIACCREVHPDLVLLDLDMPPGSGLETLRAIRREVPRVAVVILAQHGDDGRLSAALAAGAAGVYLTGHEPAELFRLLQALPWA